LLVGRFEVSTNNAYVRAEITSISPRIQGYVAQIAVTDNQAVEEGDLLIVLDNADGTAKLAEADAALAQARAQLAAQRSMLDSAKTQLQAQTNRLSEFAAAEDAAAADAELALDELSRDRDLAAKGHYPAARVNTAQTQTEAANAALKQARAAEVSQRSQISLARAGISRAESDVAAAQAGVAEAEARLAAARLDSGRAEIRAPIAGVIANKTISEGQLLNPGQQTMAIVPLDKAYVVANFKETQVERMRPGQRVELSVDAYPGLKVEGTVDSIAPASGAQFSLIPQDTATGNFTKIVQRIPVRIALSPDALATGLMRPGLSVEATVTVKPVRS
jgi:membrane fusion protein (multidrug efflux system)